MNVLADASIRDRLKAGRLGISPLSSERVQPASVDLTLGDEILTVHYGETIDPEQDQAAIWTSLDRRADGRWLLGGHRLYLGATAECVRVPDDCLGLLSGVSSLGRMGLLVHVTAGLVDPGWCGHLTLELVLIGQGIYLRPGQRIAQLTLLDLDQPTERPYRGRYRNDVRPQPAKRLP